MLRIITISGLDGSGKSTQISLLKDFFEAQGKKVFYFHTVEFGLANIIKNKYYEILHMQESIVFDKNKSIVKANWFQIQLRKLFLKIDICRFKKLYKKLEKDSFDYIISDRFFYDSIINIRYLENFDIENCKLIGNWKLPACRRGREIGNSESFYLSADPENIMQRERKPDQGIDYLKTKKELYDKAVDVWNIQIIDGNRSKEEIFEEIKQKITNF